MHAFSKRLHRQANQLCTLVCTHHSIRVSAEECPAAQQFACIVSYVCPGRDDAGGISPIAPHVTGGPGDDAARLKGWARLGHTQLQIQLAPVQAIKARAVSFRFDPGTANQLDMPTSK